MKTRPEISDQEIHQMMDFKKVLDDHRIARKKVTTMRVGFIGGAIVLAITAWYLLMPSETPRLSIQEPAPVITDSVSTEKIGKEEPVKSTTPKTTEIKKEKEVKPPADASEVTAAKDVYLEAEPVDGYPELYAYFKKELKYPVEAMKDSIEGIVSVSFVINNQGQPEQIKILNSLGAAFDHEATRVVTGMPQWKSASLNGKSVPARISMPLTFQIDKNRKQP
ncbi:MAG TPA: energy transducer TonB [Cyclobacteriaceae bacterium]|nr:energy transducer TonB [Cyclobacteriaceae bacterium]